MPLGSLVFSVLTSLNRQPLSKFSVRPPWFATPRFGSPAPEGSEAGPTSLGVVAWAPAVPVPAKNRIAATGAATAARIILRSIDPTSLYLSDG